MPAKPDQPDALTARGALPLTDEERTSVRLLPREEWFSKPDHSRPDATIPGYMRIGFPGLNASKARTSIVYMPVGQSAPVHDSTLEHLVYVLEGAFEFIVDGTRYRVNKGEQIFLPAGVFYEYRNVSLEDGCVFNVLSPVDDWPQEMIEGGRHGRYRPVT